MTAELPEVRPAAGMSERYYDAYCAASLMRLSGREIARQWYALGVGPEAAGAWARNGHTPEAGWEMMCRDLGPDSDPGPQPEQGAPSERR